MLAQKSRSSPCPSLPTGTVTFLFTDIEGSTRLLQQLGDRYASVLADHHRLLRAVFREFGGHEVDTQGEAFFITFVRARDAIAAAIEAQRVLTRGPWPKGAIVRVRMGVHTGEPLSGETGYVGMDVHRAARICGAGHGGQILLSDTTHALVAKDLPEGISLRDLGEHRLRDLAHAHRLFQVVAADLPADFPPVRSLDAHPHNLPIQLTSFIGREREIDMLRIELLGGFRASVGSRVIDEAEWRLRKARTLVKILALAPRHRFHREVAIQQLWPDLLTEAAVNNLHQVLHGARRTLEPNLPPGAASSYLHTLDEQLVLGPAGRIQIDVESFEYAAAVARRSRDVSAYRAALELYAGDLLPEDRYDDWLSPGETICVTFIMRCS